VIHYVSSIKYRIAQFNKALKQEGVCAALLRSQQFLFRRFLPSQLLHRLPKITVGDAAFIVGCGGPSSRYRVDNIAAGLSELGYDAAVFNDSRICRLDLKHPPKITVIFRHDDPYGRLMPVLTALKKGGSILIGDCDDLVFEPESIETVDAYKRLNREEQEIYKNSCHGYRKILSLCHKGTAPTHFLAARMRNIINETAIIPNTLNIAQLQYAAALMDAADHDDADKKVSTILYASGSKTHQVDFDQCAQPLFKFLCERPNWCLHIAGLLDLPSYYAEIRSQVQRSPLMPYLDLLQLTAQADINIAPLENIPFNNSKSELKIFEAGIVCVPTIASPIDSYACFLENGVDGLAAATEEEWYDALNLLADNPDLRKRMGDKAREKALHRCVYTQAAWAAAEFYGLEPKPVSNEPSAAPAMQETPRGVLDVHHLCITWILPDLLPGSGGHRNILRAAYYLAVFGHNIRIYITNEERDGRTVLEMIHKHYYPMNVECLRYDGTIKRTDVLLATHWTTVEPALENSTAAREVMYFVQDFEPWFTAMSSEYILAENTYRRNLYHICSGPWCERFLKRDYRAEADHFRFPLDRSVYFPRERREKQKTIVFFAKPEMPRRCYLLGLAALKEFHHNWAPDVKIIFFGSRYINAGAVPFPVRCASVLPTLEDLAQLYADADLGLVFSPTNPSLVPYEMMACGLPVMDLDYGDSYYNYGMRRDTAFLANPRPDVMARQIYELLDNPDELAARRRNSLMFIRDFPTEEEMGRRVEELIKKRMQRHLVFGGKI
jgi:glycosyltransferase involved in cell wall biosynthesis